MYCNSHIDLEEHEMRKEIAKETRNLWKIIISLNAGILGISSSFLIQITKYNNVLIKYVKYAFPVFLIDIILGLFLLYIDNKRRLFYLDFSKIITDQLHELNRNRTGSIDTWNEILKIEKNYGLDQQIIQKYSVISIYLDSHKGDFIYRQVMRKLYFYESRLAGIFIIIFIAGLFLLCCITYKSLNIIR